MSKGKARSVWISDDVWLDMKLKAKRHGVSVSRYVIGLHVAHLGWMIPPKLMFVDSEELDKNPDLYPEGTVGITDPEKAIKKPVIVEGSDIILHEDVDRKEGLSDVVPKPLKTVEDVKEKLDEIKCTCNEPDFPYLKGDRMPTPCPIHARDLISDDFFRPNPKTGKKRGER